MQPGRAVFSPADDVLWMHRERLSHGHTQNGNSEVTPICSVDILPLAILKHRGKAASINTFCPADTKQ